MTYLKALVRAAYFKPATKDSTGKPISAHIFYQVETKEVLESGDFNFCVHDIKLPPDWKECLAHVGKDVYFQVKIRGADYGKIGISVPPHYPHPQLAAAVQIPVTQSKAA